MPSASPGLPRVSPASLPHISLRPNTAPHAAPATPPPDAQKAADGGRLGEAWAKVLNLGVAAAAAGHLAVLASMWMANQGGPFLPYVVGAWATALMAGGMGLMGGAAKAASKA